VPTGASARYFEFDDRQARVRDLNRIALGGPIDAMTGVTYRFEDPGPYANSKLAQDVAAGTVIGVDPMSLVTLAAGIVYDTRDSEIFPRQGSYHQIGLRGTLGVPFDAGARYGAAGAMLATYKPIGGPFTLALRGVADLEFGGVPVYDLYTGGPFQTYEMPGGSAAIRGVPDGRYSGLVKVFGNAEVRALLVRFRVAGQRFRVGGNVHLRCRSPLDGLHVHLAARRPRRRRQMGRRGRALSPMGTGRRVSPRSRVLARRRLGESELAPRRLRRRRGDVLNRARASR
jgi:hypothetical protein